MAERWHLQRFMRTDLLAAAVICLLVVLLVPAFFARMRKTAERRQCAAHLAEVGRVMLLYAADYEGALPRAGGPTTAWGATRNWVAHNRNAAFGLEAEGHGGQATVSASLYLLVKYYDVPTRSFICPGDRGTTEFSLQKLVGTVPNFTVARAWDFGPAGESFKHCSYAYHMPYGALALTTSRDPGFAVAADRNPFLASPDDRARVVSSFKPDISPYRGTADQARAGNAIAHALDGQTVLFLDGRVTFQERPYCGLDEDNIYLLSPVPDKGFAVGAIPRPDMTSSNGRDSVLVHDPPTFGSGTATVTP